ncbi:hypothetical protein CH72_3193 [Burkholderia ambifaria AMMD]|nr:hypothetical protein [Burkholderia ambifaria]AJY20586.1 hypothetical protein CH72_3193 [Burkholderia ambifaria AMMD]UZU03613.1 hypothetical protein OR987_25405 [Burkholderia ambifaria]UZU10165.1 hypothetical protein OR988_25400 [Burkholderia ambifaria]WDS14047.1 hypothetical protein OR984_25365 [Burkholderia ambifaria]WDS27186.1 hypothetical protein OR983_25400 [Burkholderia ambifaria]
MATASNARQTNDAGSTDERRRDGQRTVTPTRTRLRGPAAVSQVGSRRAERGGSDGNGPVTPTSAEEAGKPLWEDDSGEMPPEEWS